MEVGNLVIIHSGLSGFNIRFPVFAKGSALYAKECEVKCYGHTCIALICTTANRELKATETAPAIYFIMFCLHAARRPIYVEMFVKKPLSGPL